MQNRKKKVYLSKNKEISPSLSRKGQKEVREKEEEKPHPVA